MSQQHEMTLAQLQADLERATQDAKDLMERLSADLREQLRQRETHLLEAPPPSRDRTDES
jgi:hypothetical protein